MLIQNRVDNICRPLCHFDIRFDHQLVYHCMLHHGVNQTSQVMAGVYILHFLVPKIRVQNWPSKKQVIHVVVQKAKFQNILNEKIEKKI